MVSRRFNAGKKKTRNWFLILVIIFLIVFLIGLTGLVFTEKENLFKTNEETGDGLASVSFFENLLNIFTASSPLNVFVQIISNNAPEILNLEDPIFVCENRELDYYFNVSDEDEDELEFSLSPYYPDVPFFYGVISSYVFEFITELHIFSGITLNKTHVNDLRFGNQGWAFSKETFTASDGQAPLVSAETDIIIIEVNNPPYLDSVGSQTLIVNSTLWVGYPKNTLYYVANVSDLETPVSALSFNLSLEGPNPLLFNISENGIINFTASLSDLTCNFDCEDNYVATVCVNDTGIENPHEDIGFWCPLETPLSIQTCKKFYLTITDKNTAPNITQNYPLNNQTLVVVGEEDLYFNISFEDEQGSVLDVNWYVYSEKTKIKEAEFNESFSELEYYFECGKSGNHTIEAFISDGDLNDSISWNFSVGLVDCPVSPQDSGGGGGGRVACKEKWGCNEWFQCNHLDTLVELGWEDKETELLIQERCDLFSYGVEVCGFQSRICIDYNYCKTKYDKPGDIRECYYTENPNCEDEIKNCHNDKCEVLVDCGGPCEACPTCYDKILNQNEERIDCGGVCKPCIELPWLPVVFKSFISYSLIALLILIIFLVVKQTLKYSKFRQIFEQRSIKNRIIRGVKKQTKTKSKRRNVVISLFFVFLLIGLLFFTNFYMMRFAQQGKIPDPVDVGFLASYGLFSNFLRGLGLFFVTVPAIQSPDTFAEVTIGDDTDDFDKWNGEEVYFYANYIEIGTGLPFATPPADCRIRFDGPLGPSGWDFMTYELVPGSEVFGYEKVFNYKGTYDFEVECSSTGVFDSGAYGFVIASETFTIKNTAPIFIQEAYQTTYMGVEDIILIHDFKENVTEPDLGDVLTFSILNISDSNPLDYPWINLTSEGILTINSTNSAIGFDETGNFEISVLVLDNEPEGQAVKFYFNILPVNDAPIFDNLINKTFNVQDLFRYPITISDEEDNVPLIINISFLSCDAETELLRGNCTLFAEDDYVITNQGKNLDIDFIPSINDLGSYLINFSVMDNSSLGNQTTSQIVNFTVKNAFWDQTENYDFPSNEGNDSWISTPLNLNDFVIVSGISFSIGSIVPGPDGFDNFVLSGANSELINFTPEDMDVGYWEVEILANDGISASSKIFNFNISNVNDAPEISITLRGTSVAEGSVNDILQNIEYDISLIAKDEDFLIYDSQKLDFYTEDLILNFNISGPNQTLFEFNPDILLSDAETFLAQFKSVDILDLGNYSIILNITDNSSVSDIFNFNISVLVNPYDVPVITGPNISKEFNLIEDESYYFNFSASHMVGTPILDYKFYINEELREIIVNGPGNGDNLTWNFIPEFTDETYEEKVNLTLIVENRIVPEYFVSRTWNLTINHTNAPIEFRGEIQDKDFPMNYAVKLLDIQEHFLDIDYYDDYHNQKVIFEILTDKDIFISEVDDHWTFIVQSTSPQYDLNMTNESIRLTNATSNNFEIEFVETEPTIVYVPVPTSGSTTTVPISLKIISPGEISIYGDEKIIIPIQLLNTGRRAFSDLSLNVSAFKDGNISNKIITSLDKDSFKTLSPGKQENLTLEVFFDEEGPGAYEILIEAKSRSPKYKDSEKIYLNPINDSNIEELLIFTEEFIAGNPQCIEIYEIIKEAESYFKLGDYVNAETKTRLALESCKNSISQVSTPKVRIPYFAVSLYLFLAMVIALVIGLIYYFIKRRRIQKSILHNPIKQEKL